METVVYIIQILYFCGITQQSLLSPLTLCSCVYHSNFVLLRYNTTRYAECKGKE